MGEAPCGPPAEPPAALPRPPHPSPVPWPPHISAAGSKGGVRLGGMVYRQDGGREGRAWGWPVNSGRTELVVRFRKGPDGSCKGLGGSVRRVLLISSGRRA